MQGRWSLTEPLFGQGDPVRRRRAQAELLLERYGLVTREHVLAEGIAGGFATLYGAFSELEALGSCRRGYFVEGLGGAQFALPGAVERLRTASPDDPLPSDTSPGEAQALVLSAIDPAQPYGSILAWPRREQRQGRGRPARVDGAYVAMVGPRPVLYLERGGRSLLTLEDGPLERALRALAHAVRAGSVAKIALERIDGEPVATSPLVELLVELGFHAGPRRLTLRA